MSGYPTSCTSAFCGRILCDGCQYRPSLVAYYKARGKLENYEAGQDQLRHDKVNKTGIYAPITTSEDERSER